MTGLILPSPSIRTGTLNPLTTVVEQALSLSFTEFLMQCQPYVENLAAPQNALHAARAITLLVEQPRSEDRMLNALSIMAAIGERALSGVAPSAVDPQSLPGQLRGEATALHALAKGYDSPSIQLRGHVSRLAMVYGLNPPAQTSDADAARARLEVMMRQAAVAAEALPLDQPDTPK